MSPVQRLLAVVGLIAIPAGALAGADADRADTAALLTWTSPWRHFIMCRPPKYATPVVDRRGRKYEFVEYWPGWHVAPQHGRIVTPAPPGGWMRPDFDDRDWPRERQPDAGEHEWTPVVALKCLRGRFLVPDPARVKDLTLEMSYIGGIVVYLNGEEVTRRHLPKGALKPDTPGEAYGERAYADASGKLLGALHPHTYSGRRPTKEVLAARYRILRTALPAGRLRPGVNVLAIEVHRSDYHPLAAGWRWTCGGMGGNIAYWSHVGVERLTLAVAPAGSAVAEPGAGPLDVWTEDIHRRVLNRTVPEAGARPPTVRMVGVRNGAFNAQVLVRGRTPLTALKAHSSDLTDTRGGRLAASAVQVRYGVARSLREQAVLLSEGRGWHVPFSFSRAVTAHVPAARTRKERQAAWDVLRLFDHLSDRPPETVPAGEAQSIWLTVNVPRGAAPGVYRGALTINASADGAALKRRVPIRVDVIDWTLPDRRSSSLFVGLHHSPYTVAAHYKIAPWSERHWALETESLKRLGEIGNDLLMLPLTSNAYKETGARESIVPWVRKPDGSYGYDLRTLDRYLDLVVRHMRRPRAVIFVVLVGPTHHRPLAAPTVTVIDDARDTRFDLALPAYDAPEAERLWKPYVEAVAGLMKRKGLGDAMHWGIFYDYAREGDVFKATTLLSRLAPDVGWARSSHNGGRLPKGRGRVSLDLRLRGFRQPFERSGQVVSRMGWRDPAGPVLFPRSASSTRALMPFDSLWAFRTTMECASVYGARGISRIGADCWKPFRFGEWFMPMVHSVLYPGPNGAESSATFEVLREGIQETEARVALERWMSDAATPDPAEGPQPSAVSGEAKRLLDERIMWIGAVPTWPPYTPIGGYHGGWQARSRALFAVAARAAKTERRR